jgi:hypothetical protein
MVPAWQPKDGASPPRENGDWSPEDGMISGRSLAFCEHAMEADQMQAWTGDKRGQALHKLQR